jgi:predicted type IV restriction endonuclease
MEILPWCLMLGRDSTVPRIIPIETVTLYELEQLFDLKVIPGHAPFWQEDLPPLTATEQERLVRIQASYANLERRSMLENTVKLAIISPLLDLAGFFLPPFYVDTETSVSIAIEEEAAQIRGRIDVLVMRDQLWVLVIESKRAEFSLKVGIPQVLSYMLAAPATNRTLYGLVTNGSNFVFLHLQRESQPSYGKSRELIIDRDDDLAIVLQILKKLGAIVGSS